MIKFVTTKKESGRVLRAIEEYCLKENIELIPWQRGITDFAATFESTVWITLPTNADEAKFVEHVKNEILL